MFAKRSPELEPSATVAAHYGREGLLDAEVHLANAYVAAASAVAGEIIDPAELGA